MYLAEFVFAIVKRKFRELFSRGDQCLTLNFGTVTMITGLILVGLIIDLGGGPDHDRRGFRVSVLQSRDVGII